MAKQRLTRDGVLDSAARLFAERGYNHTRLKDIAEPFGVTHAALYYHFERKEDILIALNTEAIEGLLEMARNVEAAGVPAAEKFEYALHGHVEYVAANVLKVASLFEGEYALPDDFREALRRQRREYTMILVRMYEAGQAAGRYREGDPTTIVSLLIGAGSWIYRWYRAERHSFSGRHLADEALRLLSSGFTCEDAQAVSPNGQNSQGSVVMGAHEEHTDVL